MIGLITAATVAVGALGGIAGVAFDPDPVPKDHVIQPGRRRHPAGAAVAGRPRQLRRRTATARGRRSPRGSRARTRPRSPSSVGHRLARLGRVHRRAERQRDREPTPTERRRRHDPDGSAASPSRRPASRSTCRRTGTWTSRTRTGSSRATATGSFSFAFSYADDPSTAAGDVITAEPGEPAAAGELHAAADLRRGAARAVRLGGVAGRHRVRSALGRQPGVGAASTARSTWASARTARCSAS